MRLRFAKKSTAGGKCGVDDGLTSSVQLQQGQNAFLSHVQEASTQRSRLACLQTHYLEQILAAPEASRPGGATMAARAAAFSSALCSDALVKLIEHLQPAHRAQLSIGVETGFIEEAEGRR